MHYIFREIVYAIIDLIQYLKNPSIKIQFRAKCTYSSNFEGFNKLSHHAFFSGEIGFASYVGANSIVIGKIGRFCSIAEKVTFLTKTHPVKEFVSSHPAFYSLKKQSGFTYITEQLFIEDTILENSKYSIEVGNDVYIGYGATIIGPCKIGNGAVIAAGAVVTGDIPDYAIVGGVPAKVIKYRFSDEDIDYLKNLQWWNKSQDWLKEHAKDFKSIKQLKFIIKKSGE